ncbi:TonB-dependent receptor [Maribellus sp. YY47]|uniref:TonB-dependent receptor n=1 Tax=Maribellus sp. YY47 TaxID=2929486 RepID=UPI002000CF21|nr:TonB-dependent receptor [Maribellus sp. YY47]MCK3684259.1 TonB-dependent receptor [Maribellus sp. YY47]
MQKLKILTLLLFCAFLARAQEVTLSGYLKDASNGEALIGATVYIPELKQGTASNAYGFYSLTIPEGTYTIRVSFIGYQPAEQQLEASESITRDFSLSDFSEEIQEVIVRGEAADANVQRVEMGMTTLPVKTIQKLPAFMGEVDVIRTIQLLPGIQSGGEASSGLYVRGGGPDENLMILDEAPVYNASHLMGFFSVFNSNAIKDIQVYKSGIPAEYGGKASSVIDIRQKDGNNKQLSLDGGIGNLSSRLTLEGPIIKDRWSFLLAGRRTYYDVLGKAMGLEELKDNALYFYDLNGKSNLIINDKNRIYLSGYNGKDVFELGESLYMRWGNTTATLRWNHIYGDKLFMNVSAIYSKYRYNLGVPGENADNFDWSSQIRDYNGKADFSYFFNPRNTFKFGINSIYHNFKPGKVITKGENSMFNDMELAEYNTLENAFYVSNEQQFSDRFTLQYGLRLSHFQQVGEGEVNIYENPEQPDKDELVETIQYGKGDKIGDAIVHLEPRVGMKFTLDGASSVKASYNRMVQNLHLISNTQSPSPLDIWLPTSTYIKPLIVDQVSMGYFRNFKNNMWETSVEVYYKDMQNVLDYKEGAELFLNENIETELLHGTGESKGLELLAKKTKGQLTGWIGYTWSKTTRKIEGINNGNPYPSDYDRTHDLSVVANYELNKRWNFAANFVYSTGSPISYPVAKYTVQGNQVFEYSARNSNRLPDYNRLDLSATYDFKKNEHRRFKQSLNFSIYNVYARRNAYSITPEANEDNPNQTQFVRLSIIGSAIPSITYNVKF